MEGSFRLTATKLDDGLLVLAADITDQVKAEKAREAGKAATLRATLDSLMDPHVLYEAIRNESGEVIDFTFVDANPAACEYNKRSREHLIGSTLAQEYPDFINDPRREAYAAVLATGEPLALDDTTWAQPRLFAGQVRHYDLRAAQVSESLLSVTWRDITDRAEAEEALEAERTNGRNDTLTHGFRPLSVTSYGPRVGTTPTGLPRLSSARTHQ